MLIAPLEWNNDDLGCAVEVAQQHVVDLEALQGMAREHHVAAITAMGGHACGRPPKVHGDYLEERKAIQYLALYHVA